MNQWILDTVAGLPGHWIDVSENNPSIRVAHGTVVLQDLTDWLSTGKFSQASFPLPNILLTHLVVITHLVEYLGYLDSIQPGSDNREDHHEVFKNDVETLGFCTGLLSALVVSSSANQVDLEQQGARVIRLAILFGAVVDARDNGAGPHEISKSFSLAWNSNETETELTRIVKSFPEVGKLYYPT